MTVARTWTGGFVTAEVGIEVHTDPGRSAIPLEDLLGLALRHNPRRAHLIVSTVLGKHVPTEPDLILAAGTMLGLLVAGELDGSGASVPDAWPPAGRIHPTLDDFARLAQCLREPDPLGTLPGELLSALREGQVDHPDVVTVGFAETATALGRQVADAIGSYYLHSTRHAVARTHAAAAFEETHSHASSHQILAEDAGWLRERGTVVLVDDELTSGATVVSTIRALQHLVPQTKWIVAALVDLRSDTDRQSFDELAEELSTKISVVTLGAGTVNIPLGTTDTAAALIESLPHPTFPAGEPAPLILLDLEVDVAPIRSDRFGTHPAQRAETASTAEAISAALTAVCDENGRPVELGSVLVLGTEEFMSLPLEVASRLPGAMFSTTTRSPIAALDRPDYAVATAVTFDSYSATTDGPGPRFAYNLTRANRRFDTILVMPEPGTELHTITGPGSLCEALRPLCARLVVVLLDSAHDAVVVSASTPGSESSRVSATPLYGPQFGSYAADEVAWLLQDLGDRRLEAPTAQRERAIQTGQANYAESLPIEYVPSKAYQQLYRNAVRRSSRRVAEAVGVVSERAFEARGRHPVLVSLARAGTPIGILMRRWLHMMHHVDAPHYTMSIVRGVGVDATALRYLAAHHDPADILFVDGWTGKGAIARELTAALNLFAQTDRVRFSSTLAVLADPGHCATLFGTRDDYLIPSACLNSTISGLVSRTVYSRELIADDEFHGAKFYRELRGDDVSKEFLDAVSAHFPAVRGTVGAFLASAEPSALDSAHPTWEGWQAVERIAYEYSIKNINLIKPGVGETTRVLLRRVPWKILVNPGALGDLEHVLLLAAQRGVDVVEVEGLPYSCIGIINPDAALESDV